VKVNVLKRAGMALSAVALVLGGVAVPALLAPSPAWAQSSGIVPFTPAGLGTDHYVIPVGAESRPTVAAVVVGFENDTDASVTLKGYSILRGYASVGNSALVTVPSRGTYLNSVMVFGVGPWKFQVTLSNGQTVAWTIDGGPFSNVRHANPLNPLMLSPVLGKLGEVEPALDGEGTFGTVRFMVVGAIPGEEAPSLSSCVTTAPLQLGPSACQTTSEGSMTAVTANVGFPVQTSLSGWQPGQAVVGVVATMALSVPSDVATEYDVPSSMTAVVAVPVLYTVPEVIPSSISVSADASTWTPVGFTAGRYDGGISLVSASLSGADQADFEVESSASAHTPPPGGGTWNPIDVKLVAKAPGTYTADIVATFDPTGGHFTVTIPVTGSVPGVTSSGSGSSNPPTLIGLGSSTTQSSSGSGSSTTPTSPPVFTPPPPEPVAVGETCGAAGTEVQIWGENLAGSVVRFANATSGAVKMLSPTEAEATVPHGVDGLGPITVIGPGGQAAQVPGVTWDPTCQTRTMAWTTPGGPEQVVLHVALVSASSAFYPLPGRTVVVLGRDGEQVERFETGSAPTTFLLPISEGPFTAVFDGGAHFGPSESAAVG